jgi:hypothetical protein
MEEKIELLNMPKSDKISCITNYNREIVCYSGSPWKQDAKFLFRDNGFIVRDAEAFIDSNGEIIITPTESGKKLIIGEKEGFKVVMTEK